MIFFVSLPNKIDAVSCAGYVTCCEQVFQRLCVGGPPATQGHSCDFNSDCGTGGTCQLQEACATEYNIPCQNYAFGQCGTGCPPGLNVSANNCYWSGSSPSPSPNPCATNPCAPGCTYVLPDNTCNVDTCIGCNKRTGEVRSTYDNSFCSSQCSYDATCPSCCVASCTPACGQASGCGGFCPTTDGGAPSNIFSFNPANGGTAAVSGANTITVAWNGDTRADQWYIELYALGPDPNCPALGGFAQIILTPSFTFTPFAQCNQYRYRVIGINASCGVEIGAYSAYQDFTALANINGSLFLDADGDATPTGPGGMCIDPDGNVPVNWGAGAWAGAVGQAGWVPAYITTNVYGVTVPYWPDVPPNTVNNLVGVNPGTDGSNNYVCSCPQGCSYNGIGSPEANVNIYVQSCASGATACATNCGQDNGCGGFCPTTDGGAPNPLPVVTPANGGTAVIAGTDVTVSWTEPDPRADLYYVAIWPVGEVYDCNAAYMYCEVIDGNSYTFAPPSQYYQYNYQLSPVNATCGVEQGGIVSGSFTIVAPVTGNLYYDADGDAAPTGPGGICQDPDGDTNTLGGTGSNAFIGAVARDSSTPTALPTGTTYSINLPWWPSTVPGNNVVGYDPGDDLTNTPYVCSCPSTAGCAYGGIASPQSGVNYFFTDAPVMSDGWWQIIGGNGFAGATAGIGLYAPIPTVCTAPTCQPYLSTRDDADRAGSSGAFISGGASLDSSADAGIQESGINQDGGDWFAQGITTTRLQENYTFFYREFSMGLNPTDDFALNPDDAQLPGSAPSNGRAYYRNGNLTIQDPWIVNGGREVVVFVNGNLTITDPAAIEQLITVEEGSFLAFIVSGNIIIDDTVGNADLNSAVPNIEGVYLAGGATSSLTIESNGVNDLRFVGAGNFIGLGSVQLNREFADLTDNNDRAIETFVFRPDFVRYLPERMARPRYLWQETN